MSEANIPVPRRPRRRLRVIGPDDHAAQFVNIPEMPPPAPPASPPPFENSATGSGAIRVHGPRRLRIHIPRLHYREPASNPRRPPTGHRSALPSGKPLFYFSTRYRAVDIISTGLRGPVYKAYDSLLDSYVAIKFLPASMTGDPEAVRLFKREASMAMRLSHENIVKLHNLEAESGRLFLVMEYVTGRDFRAILREMGALAPSSVAAIAASCAAALDYAHKIGVLHRDLKPENLMLDERSVLKIVDFGTSRPIHIHVDGGTDEDFVEGTPGYMSPEQAAGGVMDRRTDVYSLGVTLAELLGGRQPPPQPPASGSACGPQIEALVGLPDPAREAIERATAIDLTQRWASAGDFAQALAAALPAED